MNAQWRCVLIGRESLLVQCATLLRERGHEIAAVIAADGPARDWASGEGVALLTDPAALTNAGIGAFDYLFSITNLTVLPDSLLQLPRLAAINFHDGPLPHYAGLNTPVWALLDGRRRHGVTWHHMTAEVDGGAIVAARVIAIDAGETAYSLNTKCFAAGIESFDDVLDQLAAGAPPLAQGTPPHRLFGRRHRPDGACCIDWGQPAERIAALVRALDHGGHANPLGLAKMATAAGPLLVESADVLESASDLAPGTVLRVVGDAIIVATATQDIALRRFAGIDGTGVVPRDVGLQPGTCLDALTPELRARLSSTDSAVAPHETYWRKRLVSLVPLTLPVIDAAAPAGAMAGADQSLTAADASVALAAIAATLGRIADKDRFDVAYRDPALAQRFARVEQWFCGSVPLAVTLDHSQPLDSLARQMQDAIGEAHRRRGYAADLIARTPGLRGRAAALPVAIHIVDDLDQAAPEPGADLTIALRADGGACRWLSCPARIAPDMIARLQQALATVLAAVAMRPALSIAALPLVDEPEPLAPATPWREDACLHQLVSEQAARTPDGIAVTCRGRSLTYAQLDARSNQLARHLQRLGVGPDTLVGLFAERSVDLPVALLAIHKAGGAYVPLDPAYPADRVAHMLADSAAPVIVTQAHLEHRLPPHSAALVRLDSDGPRIAAEPGGPVESGVAPANLAYVIYTSGSTGRPKGVMVEHRNVANFFAGMDRRIAPGGVWLAVTSLSFDISVLEIFWTLARGFHVVLATGEEMKGAAPAARPIDFSLFYFSADEASDAGAGDAGGKYRLLLEGAKFADTHGFTAVWTPERHFHAFGGLYPNPAVTGAAVAAITSRVQIRGGSVVLPLHHPARVAEEWALVDNLSGGRVGVAFASGWQPNDFVLRPESFADRNAALIQGIDTVQALWRGETRSFAGPLGTPVAVQTLPRPVQPTLPFWITSAGNVQTFEAAGRAGASVLTHLLGQSLEELSVKIAAYRAARHAAGHAGDGHVTLMLHSFVGPHAEEVREAVKAPMIAYLRTATALVKQYAWAFPAFKRRPGMAEAEGQADLEALSDADMDMLLEFAFDRYYETSGLFGTPDTCLAMVDRVRAAGADEIACLIDFGVATDRVLAHLPWLDTLRGLAQRQQQEPAEPLPALMARHGVTHLQCTPSLAQMLLAEEGARPALAQLRHMMIGGEAFPPALARELGALVGGTVSNMYGPTETTIWSASHDLDGREGAVPLGTALANQRLHILDSRQQPLPIGVPGEIVITGVGVVRGYLDRPELTAERFVMLPSGERAYRTGDLGRRDADGSFTFLGRLDHQVKLRGYRIELGEIEAVLIEQAAVEEAVVVARRVEDGDARLIAYVTGSAEAGALRDHLRARLPEFMLPAQIVALAALPRTPNGKIDRNALPAPDQVEAPVPQEEDEASALPVSAMEERIAGIWRDVLKLGRVGVRDNFFDLGGHSLLAVQMHRRVKAELAIDLPITDIFRFPSIQTLSAHLSAGSDDAATQREGQERAQGRLAALARRKGQRVLAMADRGN